MNLSNKPQPPFDEGALWMKNKNKSKIGELDLYDVEMFGYLEAKQISVLGTPYNVVKLADALINASGRTKIINTDYAFYKVNSVLYPVIDVDTGQFIEADRWYQVINGAIKLYFPPMMAQNGLQADCIYSDDCDQIYDMDQNPQVVSNTLVRTFNMYVTVTNKPGVPVGTYKQSLSMFSYDSALATRNCAFAFDNARDFDLTGVGSTGTFSVKNVSLYYAPSSKQIRLQDNGYMLEDNTPGYTKNIIILRRDGRYTDRAAQIIPSRLVNSYHAQIANGRLLNMQGFYFIIRD